jgi:hypothetical protein
VGVSGNGACQRLSKLYLIFDREQDDKLENLGKPDLSD